MPMRKTRAVPRPKRHTDQTDHYSNQKTSAEHRVTSIRFHVTGPTPSLDATTQTAVVYPKSAPCRQRVSQGKRRPSLLGESRGPHDVIQQTCTVVRSSSACLWLAWPSASSRRGSSSTISRPSRRCTSARRALRCCPMATIWPSMTSSDPSPPRTRRRRHAGLPVRRPRADLATRRHGQRHVLGQHLRPPGRRVPDGDQQEPRGDGDQPLPRWRRHVDRAPKDKHSGLLLDDAKYHCAPVPVVVHEGRIWRAMEDAMGPGGWGSHFRSFMMSAPADCDLLDADNWVSSNRLGRDPNWLDGKFRGWLEGNAVVTPQGGSSTSSAWTIVPRAKRPRSSRSATTAGKATFDPNSGFIDFPGGAKKFTIRFDPVSRMYWTLSNPVLPQTQGPGSRAGAKCAGPDAVARPAALGDPLHRSLPSRREQARVSSTWTGSSKTGTSSPPRGPRMAKARTPPIASTTPIISPFTALRTSAN